MTIRAQRLWGELNGQHVKLAKVKGEFVWHDHHDEDELFFVIKGTLRIEFRDKTVTLNTCAASPKWPKTLLAQDNKQILPEFRIIVTLFV